MKIPTRTLIQSLQDVILSLTLATALLRLGNMQLEGLLTFGGVVLGLLVGFTSLNFNRARAYPSGPAQRRSLLAAELSFRATLFYTLGIVLTTFIYFMLTNFGYQPTPVEKSPTQVAPLVMAFVPLIFCTVTVVLLSQATRTLSRGMRRLRAKCFVKGL